MLIASMLAAAALQPVTAATAEPNIASFISDDDYPASAIRNEEQGTVAFAVDVTPQGAVAGCRVEKSSGSEALDGTTCRIITERARFKPARDSRNRAVADVFKGRIMWRLPEPQPGENPFSGMRRQVNNVWEVTAAGAERSCRRELVFDGNERFDVGTCLLLDRNFVLAAAARLGARPEEILTIRLENHWQPDPAKPLPAHQQHLGEVFVRGVGTYSLDGEQVVSGCEAGPLEARIDWRPAPCFRKTFADDVPKGTTSVRMAVQWVVSRGPDTQRPKVLPRFVDASGKETPVTIRP